MLSPEKGSRVPAVGTLDPVFVETHTSIHSERYALLKRRICIIQNYLHSLTVKRDGIQHFKIIMPFSNIGTLDP